MKQGPPLQESDISISCVVNDSLVQVDQVDVNTSVLYFLRDHLNLRGTKEGCGSGDCGACTVILSDLEGDDPSYYAINSCIAPAGVLNGKQVISVEGLVIGETLHPVQQAMVDCHGSQCGFCTPGFVMALVDHSLKPDVSSQCGYADVVSAISGNLCRCTGYRPIVKAGMDACARANPKQFVPTDDVRAGLLSGLKEERGEQNYLAPDTELELAQALANPLPGRSRLLLAGGTDAWLEVTQNLRSFDQVIDLSKIKSLMQIDESHGRLAIGSATTQTQLLEYFDQGPSACAHISAFLHRFGSKQVRNRATLGGNLCSASPVGDWSPLLLALDAELVAASLKGRRTISIRDFFTGYRKTCLGADEYLASIEFELPADWRAVQVHKVTKRFEDDISSVFLALNLHLDGLKISGLRITLGGMAETPIRFFELEDFLQGQRIESLDWAGVKNLIRSSLSPISDVRASSEYRSAMVYQLIRTTLLNE